MGKKISANEEIKRNNHSDVFELFLHNSTLTKQDIVSKLNLSLPTVTANIEELIEKGLFLKNHAEEVFRTIDILKRRDVKWE